MAGEMDQRKKQGVADQSLPRPWQRGFAADGLEERFFAGARACQQLRDALLLLARAGDLEFRVLEPPGSPNARWTALSDDVVRALESDDLDIDESKVQLPDGPRLEARIFHSPAPDWRTSTSLGVETQALSA